MCVKKKTVAVLFGGRSSEYSVSLQSAYTVIKNIDKAKYDLVLIGITKNGDWYRYYGDIEAVREDSWHSDPMVLSAVAVVPGGEKGGLIEFGREGSPRIELDCVLPMLHGKNGEDGTVQGLFELAGVPIAGCGSLGSSVCMNKHLTQRLAESVGVSVPSSVVLRQWDDKSAAMNFAEKVGYPLFVKPVKTGSSYGVTKVERGEELYSAIDAAFNYDDTVMVEEAIAGQELCCAVMGNSDLIMGEIDEVEVKDGFYDFEAKYRPKSTVIHLPARIPAEERDRIREIAGRLYKVTGCNGFARVDMFYTKEGKVVFGEINTIPGFTEHSHFPRMMQAAGYSISQVIDYFIDNAK